MLDSPETADKGATRPLSVLLFRAGDDAVLASCAHAKGRYRFVTSRVGRVTGGAAMTDSYRSVAGPQARPSRPARH